MDENNQEYHEGYMAQGNGADESENPYDIGDPKFLKWQRGWDAGYLEEYGGDKR